ncbi:MAG TPA: HAMP domain-containing sensor histidine kinase [Polyangia bacterium]|nr:HAMP domain-containing sensor histidine kinase [Polyangia bacterium]
MSPNSTQPVPVSGIGVLGDAADSQRRRILSTAASLRLVGSVMFLVVSIFLWKGSGDVEWGRQVPILIAYGTLALITFATQGRTVMLRLAWVQPVLDVGFVYAVLRTALLVGTMGAQTIAGLSVGVFVLPIAVGGLAFRTRCLVLVTLLATMCELSLMQQADLGTLPMLTATAVLLLAAASSKLARETAEAEVTRRILADTRAQYEKLGTLQKEKDSLVRVIVHDMRSPVGTTMLSLEYLDLEMRRHPVSKPWLEAVEEALAGSGDVSEMIAQILDTTTLENGRIAMNLATVEARDLLDKARDSTATHARSKSIRIELDVQDGLPVAADSRLFLRLLQSLITASIRRTPNGGRILLEATRGAAEVRIAVHCTAANIPSEQRETTFDKFQPGDQGARRLSGWGQGLYFCRMVAQAHGGTLAVETCEGWPSSFVIHMPMAQAQGQLSAGRGKATRESHDSGIAA